MITATVNPDGTLNTESTTMYSTSKTTSNSALDKDAFLQLLVAEMKYQDPLEPNTNTDYVAQLATFSQVEEMQNMQNSMQQEQASDLVGRVVIMKTENTSGETGYVAGTVDYWEVIKGKIYLGINGNLYDIDDIDTVMSKEYYEKYISDNVTDDTKDSTTEDTTDATV